MSDLPKTPDTIYLIPGEWDGAVGWLWSDDPAPSAEHDPSEAVEYVRGELMGAGDAVTINHPLIRFLLGEGQYRGKWFGETERRGDYNARYWWRMHLRGLLTTPQQSECDCCGYPGHDLPKYRKMLRDAAPQPPAVQHQSWEQLRDLLMRDICESDASPEFEDAINSLYDELHRVVSVSLEWRYGQDQTPAVPEWHDIKTAPRDGTEIVAAWPMFGLDLNGNETDTVIGYEKAVTHWNGGWLEPEALNNSGPYFGDNFVVADRPTLWSPMAALDAGIAGATPPQDQEQ